MDVNTRIKVLTRRITIYKSELPDKNRTNGPLPKYLQTRQFIGQDLVALEGCFPNQKEFNDYTLKPNPSYQALYNIKCTYHRREMVHFGNFFFCPQRC
jgi:hypothetical protein